uniref:Sacsin/Nov domain-containing protein n=1 Tax=Candidatus Desulfatibia profunda TaxID=2841695 RepID=A0A8J6NL80_9BACT|nr:hypothetical protein [Candidatus Desulfatibia profunda]
MQIIDRQLDSRIVRDPLDEVRAIKSLLADVYKDAGDGRSLVRELVQNADDACSRQLVFAVLHSGWSNADNSLLHGPALIVANDGPFPYEDQRGLHRAIGGSKSADASKIGRFGLGLKTIFRICESLVYLGAENGVQFPGALNPWAGSDGRSNVDPLHPDWDKVSESDQNRLSVVAIKMLGRFENGLLLWVPLRQKDHLDRARDRLHGIDLFQPKPANLSDWFGQPATLGLLLTQCGHLSQIRAEQLQTPDATDSRKVLAYVSRPDPRDQVWVGRYQNDDQDKYRRFDGQVKTWENGFLWNIIGAEKLGSNTLRDMRRPPWPLEEVWAGGQSEQVPRKALAHAAITVLFQQYESDQVGEVRIRWAVFLPLDDDPTPPQGNHSKIIECMRCTECKGHWEIVLHGYFWPTQDRQSIPGVTDDDIIKEDDLRAKWNRTLRDEILLPLIPQTLSRITERVEEIEARHRLDAIKRSAIVQRHLNQVTRTHLLLPVVSENRVLWQSLPTKELGRKLLSIRNWNSAPQALRVSLVGKILEAESAIIVIDEDAPRLGGTPQAWPSEWFTRLLNSVPISSLKTLSGLKWLKEALTHILSIPTVGSNNLLEILTDWLAKQIGERILAQAIEGKTPDEQAQLRAAWYELFLLVPQAWRVPTAIGAHSAVVELAKVKSIGAGLLPIPLGRAKFDAIEPPSPDMSRLRAALRILGQRLRDEHGASQRVRNARLFLSEDLLTLLPDSILDDELGSLPLLRAHRMPEGRDEAWSITDLRREQIRQRVFAKMDASVDTDSEKLDGKEYVQKPYDPNAATYDLSKALEQPVWLVGDTVAAKYAIPHPYEETLASALLSEHASYSVLPEDRMPLLIRLAKSVLSTKPGVLRAIKTLLTGQYTEPSDPETLYYIRSDDTEREENELTLQLLVELLGTPWIHVHAALIEPLPHAVVQKLGIAAVDSGRFQMILQQALDANVNWLKLERANILHLLRRLHSSTHHELDRWRQMPLHRIVGESRGSIDARSFRASGNFYLLQELMAEVRLIDPDPEVADLYSDLQELDQEGILRLMLISEKPYRFSQQIVQSLMGEDSQSINLPNNKDLIDLLQSRPWLPNSNAVSGIPPNTLLLLPQDLKEIIRPLARNGALGGHFLVDEVEPELWSIAESVVFEVLKRPTILLQIRKLAESIDKTLLPTVEGGAFMILTETNFINEQRVYDALKTNLPDSILGWAVVRVAANNLGIDVTNAASIDAASQRALILLAKTLCGPVSSEWQLKSFKALSVSRPGQESPAGRMFGTLIEAFRPTAQFFQQVLPLINLPTQDGQWQPSSKIARSAAGVARRHRIISSLRAPMGLDSDEPLPSNILIDSPSTSHGTVEALSCYFEEWTSRVPNAAVGAFIALLGNGKDDIISDLAQKWIGEDVEISGLRSPLVENFYVGIHRIEGVRIFVRGQIKTGSKVTAVNLLGEIVEMDADEQIDTIFASDPVRRHSAYGDFWEITLRNVDPASRTSHELLDYLGGTVEYWAVRVLGIDQQVVRTWWSTWGTTSQAQVGPVLASVYAHLPLTLLQLNIQENDTLRNAVLHAQRAQRRREQAQGAQLDHAIRAERKALDSLADLIKDGSEHISFLTDRVRELMERYGYRSDSTLLELVQNADDALAQAAEISESSGRALPVSASRILIRLTETEGQTVIELIHYGRPINETGGTVFPDGIERQWDQDLYFMMLLNLSGKTGEQPGRGVSGATTGRFGLGFKSVHLVSDRPQVVSGFLAFQIAGGLLPIVEPVPNDPNLHPVDGCLATRVRLPLRSDMEHKELIEKVFRRFAPTRALVPVFARQIREVIVEGGPYAGRSDFYARELKGAPGWALGDSEITMSDGRRLRLLRYRPADAGDIKSTAALVVGIHEGTPTTFPPSLPFIWNVTPTSEGWGCGYAINGPFKLDPGRTHVSLDDNATLMVIDMLGESLGNGLIQLNDCLRNNEERSADSDLPVGDEAEAFLGKLWTVLATGIDSPDELRQQLLFRLHCDGRGISAWMAARPVVPSDLPKPFLRCLQPICDMRIEVTTEALENEDVCRAFASIPDVDEIAKRHSVVSRKIARMLQPILRRTMHQLSAGLLLNEVTKEWNQELTQERLAALRPLSSDDVWRAVINDTGQINWAAQLRARSADGEWCVLRRLLLPQNLDEGWVPQEFRDEPRRSSFAPKKVRLEDGYLKTREDLLLFLRLRTRHEVDVPQIASWYVAIPENKRLNALRYLVEGELARDVLKRLRPDDQRPDWLKDFDKVRDMLDSAQLEDWQSQSLLAALFPDSFEQVSVTGDDSRKIEYEEDTITPLQPESAKKLLLRLYQKWSVLEYRTEKIREWRDQWYPAGWPDKRFAEGLRNKKHDEDELQDAWMILFVLGTVQGLGRTKPCQHRGFVEILMDRNAQGVPWWRLLFGRFDQVANSNTWFNQLEDWANRRNGRRLPYDHWLTMLPELFAAWRWLPEYREILMACDRRKTIGPYLLRPREDTEQQLGGSDAPALPLVRYHWLLREMIRFEILKPTETLIETAWPPSRALEQTLCLLGADVNRKRHDFANCAWRFLSQKIGPEKAHFFKCFDLPLLSREFQDDLRAACTREKIYAGDNDAWFDEGSGLLGDVPAENPPVV